MINIMKKISKLKTYIIVKAEQIFKIYIFRIINEFNRIA